MYFLSNRLSNIRNGQFNKLPYVTYTQNNSAIIVKRGIVLTTLRKQGIIRAFSFTEVGHTSKFQVTIYLKYTQTGKGVFDTIFAVSKPGRRVYLGSKCLWQPRTTRGVFIVSTTKGIITDSDARRFNLGGEVLFGVA